MHNGPINNNKNKVECMGVGGQVSWLVRTWDHITAKTNFNLFPIYSAHKSSNHKFSQNHKISPDANLHKKYTNIKHNIFE